MTERWSVSCHHRYEVIHRKFVTVNNVQDRVLVPKKWLKIGSLDSGRMVIQNESDEFRKWKIYLEAQLPPL
jgi:hypothetical protein